MKIVLLNMIFFTLIISIYLLLKLIVFISQPGPAGSCKKDAFDADFDDDDVKAPSAPTSLRMRQAPKVRRTTTEGGTPWDEDVTKVSVTRDAKPVGFFIYNFVLCC